MKSRHLILATLLLVLCAGYASDATQPSDTIAKNAQMMKQANKNPQGVELGN